MTTPVNYSTVQYSTKQWGGVERRGVDSKNGLFGFSENPQKIHLGDEKILKQVDAATTIM